MRIALAVKKADTAYVTYLRGRPNLTGDSPGRIAILNVNARPFSPSVTGRNSCVPPSRKIMSRELSIREEPYKLAP